MIGWICHVFAYIEKGFDSFHTKSPRTYGIHKTCAFRSHAMLIPFALSFADTNLEQNSLPVSESSTADHRTGWSSSTGKSTEETKCWNLL